MDKATELRHYELEDKILDDCWKRYGEFIKSESSGACKSKNELWDYLSDLDFSDWEEIAYFTGKIRGLQEARRLIA